MWYCLTKSKKAHPDIQNILLQIWRTVSSHDAMGRKADFRNTIVLLTSNLGARFLPGRAHRWASGREAKPLFEKQSAQAIEEAKKWFRPSWWGGWMSSSCSARWQRTACVPIAEKLLGQLEAVPPAMVSS